MAVFVDVGGVPTSLESLGDVDAVAALQSGDRIHIVGPHWSGGLTYEPGSDRWRHRGTDHGGVDVFRDGNGRRWLVPGRSQNPHPTRGQASWRRG